jgi:hypothetical protein
VVAEDYAMADTQDVKLMLGSIPTYALMILLFPIFIVLALLYMTIHSERADGTEEEPALADLLPSHQ